MSPQTKILHYRYLIALVVLYSSFLFWKQKLYTNAKLQGFTGKEPNLPHSFCLKITWGICQEFGQSINKPYWSISPQTYTSRNKSKESSLMATIHAVQISTIGYKVIKRKSVSESNPYGKIQVVAVSLHSSLYKSLATYRY